MSIPASPANTWLLLGAPMAACATPSTPSDPSTTGDAIKSLAVALLPISPGQRHSHDLPW